MNGAPQTVAGCHENSEAAAGRHMAVAAHALPQCVQFLDTPASSTTHASASSLGNRYLQRWSSCIIMHWAFCLGPATPDAGKIWITGLHSHLVTYVISPLGRAQPPCTYVGKCTIKQLCQRFSLGTILLRHASTSAINRRMGQDKNKHSSVTWPDLRSQWWL